MSDKMSVPSYLECAKPNPASNRAPWYKNTAPTYAGIFLWFVFWSYSVSSGTPGGILSAGVGVALLSVLVAALLCHFAFYYLPARFGQKTGLPLYIVGSSTFGATGGFLLPGFLMGLLQFGWLAVNIFGSSMAMNQMFEFSGFPLYVVMALWGIAAVVAALKGIQYVAKFSTYLPLIPAAILIVLVVKTISGLGSFDPQALVAASSVAAVPVAGTVAKGMSAAAVFAFVLTYIVGFFATAGAAGVDFGTGSRDKKDVALGGLTGVALAIFLTIGAAILITAGYYGTDAGKAAMASGAIELNPMNLMGRIFNDGIAKWLAFALAITAFPSACFSSLIAANSIKTTLPKVNPWISCGIGCVVAIALAISGVAGKAVAVFAFIGASFGPICGAIAMEYILSKGRWSGPRAAFNPAGWVAWAIGFVIGVQPNFAAQCGFTIPAAPVVAFIAGAGIYALLYKKQTPVLAYPQAEAQAAD
ncbi:MAG: cytosine permease [Kiritimatiellae bacterium]|nr:cytosine permease [Kiritimatiellia bacterium]